MFGTIGHARLKPGRMDAIRELMDVWQREIRPGIPGPVISVTGNKAGSPDEAVFVALMQDEATYRALAAKPEQDAWFRQMAEHFDGDVSWEDVEMEVGSLQ